MHISALSPLVALHRKNMFSMLLCKSATNDLYLVQCGTVDSALVAVFAVSILVRIELHYVFLRVCHDQ